MIQREKKKKVGGSDPVPAVPPAGCELRRRPSVSASVSSSVK